MLEFSELLREYAGRSAYNYVQIAKMCGVERSLLMKFCSGKRKPQNMEIVEKIADVLMLTVAERDEFFEAYDMMRVGKGVYIQRKNISRLMEKFSEFVRCDKIEIKLAGQRNTFIKKEMKVVSGNANVIAYLQNLMLLETNREKCEISIFMPNQHNDIMTMLKGICNKANISIRQLIVLEQMREHCESDNIQNLLNIIPLLFGKCEYRSGYYYENRFGQNWLESAFDNYILINEYCITYNTDLKNLIIYRSREIARVYQQYFDYVWKMGHEFAVKIRKEDIFDTYNTTDFVSMRGIPCLSFGFTRSFLRGIGEYDGIPGWDEMIEKSMKRIETFADNISMGGKPLKMITDRRGCLEFMDEGYPVEIPKGYYKEPLPIKERIRLMKKLIHYMKKGYVEAYIVREECLAVDSRIICDLLSHESIVLIDASEGYEYTMIKITENSIVEAYRDYMETYLIGEASYSKEESIEIMELMVEEYSKNLKECSIEK